MLFETKSMLYLKSAKVTLSSYSITMAKEIYKKQTFVVPEHSCCDPSYLWYCFEFLWWAKWCGCPCHGCLFGFTCCMINQCFIPWRTWYCNVCVNCSALFHLAEMDYRKDCWQVSRWLCQGSKRSVTYKVCSCVTKSQVCNFIYLLFSVPKHWGGISNGWMILFNRKSLACYKIYILL